MIKWMKKENCGCERKGTVRRTIVNEDGTVFAEDCEILFSFLYNNRLYVCCRELHLSAEETDPEADEDFKIDDNLEALCLVAVSINEAEKITDIYLPDDMDDREDPIEAFLETLEIYEKGDGFEESCPHFVWLKDSEPHVVKTTAILHSSQESEFLKGPCRFLNKIWLVLALVGTLISLAGNLRRMLILSSRFERSIDEFPFGYMFLNFGRASDFMVPMAVGIILMTVVLICFTTFIAMGKTKRFLKRSLIVFTALYLLNQFGIGALIRLNGPFFLGETLIVSNPYYKGFLIMPIDYLENENNRFSGEEEFRIVWTIDGVSISDSAEYSEGDRTFSFQAPQEAVAASSVSCRIEKTSQGKTNATLFYWGERQTSEWYHNFWNTTTDLRQLLYLESLDSLTVDGKISAGLLPSLLWRFFVNMSDLSAIFGCLLFITTLLIICWRETVAYLSEQYQNQK
ncbi:MAG: hypothetical protein LUE65_01305 [Clostridiales bacterium]|nr:hypothetical protein [Clostridiales bacterium]